MILFTTPENRYDKVVVINESTAFDILLEAATTAEIHDRYYADIPEDDFTAVIQADPTFNPQNPDKMGRYGKWLLNLYKGNRLETEDLYKAKEYLALFDKFRGKIDRKDIGAYRSLPELYRAVEPFMQDPQQAATKGEEIRRVKENGAERFYEDPRWVVIIPKTEEASIYYGKGTQWCTAAARSDNRFNFYNSRGNLYINIDKANNRKYQLHFEMSEFMDETNDPIAVPIAETIGMSEGLLNRYRQVSPKYAAVLLCDLDKDETEPVRGQVGKYVYQGNKIIELNGDGTYNTLYELPDGYSFEGGHSIGRKYMPVHNDINKYYTFYDIETKSFIFDENTAKNIKMISPLHGWNNARLILANRNMALFSGETGNIVAEANTIITADSFTNAPNAYRNLCFAIDGRGWGQRVYFPIDTRKGRISDAVYPRIHTNKLVFPEGENPLNPQNNELTLPIVWKQGDPAEQYYWDAMLPDGTTIPYPKLAQMSTESLRKVFLGHLG